MNKNKNRLSNLIPSPGLRLASFVEQISNRLQINALCQKTPAKRRLAVPVMGLDFEPRVPYGEAQDSPSNMEKALKAIAARKYSPKEYRLEYRLAQSAKIQINTPAHEN